MGIEHMNRFQNYDSDDQLAAERNHGFAARRGGAHQRLDRTMERTALGGLPRGDCGGPRIVWCGYGILASATAGILRSNQISAHHSADHLWKCAAQCHARSSARAESQFAPVVPGG